MDASVMSVNGGMYRCIGQKLRNDLGGKNFDNNIVKHLIQVCHAWWKMKRLDC